MFEFWHETNVWNHALIEWLGEKKKGKEEDYTDERILGIIESDLELML